MQRSSSSWLSRARRPWRCTSQSAASGRCGISRAVSTSASWRPGISRKHSAGGSFQLFIQADFEQHYFTLREKPEHRAPLQRMCLFDLVANNADRKSGHCLLGPDGIYGVDNGLCFHVEPKLRTVIWDFGGEPIPDEMLADVRRFARAKLPKALAALLDPDEQKALRARAGALANAECFPVDTSGHRYPWPLV